MFERLGAMLRPAALREGLNNQFARDRFVHAQLAALAPGSVLLDAGCGSQRYREHCRHLSYKAQDFGAYTSDEQKMLGTAGVGGVEGYVYGQLDYVGDIWNIAERDASFDVILCTEVLEHIPYPNQTVAELARLLKPAGQLILTAPSNCLRHMDPYFFYSGFSDRWYERILTEHGLVIEHLEPVGDYYRWLAVELARTARIHSWLARIILAPAFLFLYARRATPESISTLCMGYHIVARKP